jgi:hypothetical protein
MERESQRSSTHGTERETPRRKAEIAMGTRSKERRSAGGEREASCY